MVVEIVAEWAVSLISSGGGFWLFFLMGLESMIFPIPSEVVMPLAGFLISKGTFSWIGVLILSTIGTIVGSLISYYMGLFGGRPFIRRYGKYFLLDDKHLEWTERFFRNRGEKAIFISRFLPVVRHLISIPAGMGKMNLKKFIFYTAIGGAMWNMFLAWLGFYLSDKWNLIHTYSKSLDIIVLVLLVGALIWWILIHLKRKRIKRQE